MWQGTGSLAVAFVLIVSVLLLIFIKPNIKTWIKAIIIPVVIWFGFAVWFVPMNLMGWPLPTEIGEIPGNSIVKSIIINEPAFEDDGNICFWLVPLPAEIEQVLLNPKTASMPEIIPNEPRSYRIPYNKELHSKLLKAQEEKDKSEGNILLFKGLRSSSGDKSKNGVVAENEDDFGFKIINLQEVFKK